MTNLLTPGAKALLNGKEVVTIAETQPYKRSLMVIRKDGDAAFLARILRPHNDLTPLLTAVVQEDGTVREVNWQGDAPDHPDGLLFADEDREQVYREYEEELSAWRIAEASRRTWPVEPNGPCGYWMALIGRSVLGYVPADKFIIVKIQTP